MRAIHSMLQVDASPAPQQLMMKVLALVTEIMVDDVALAEQMRTAVMSVWLAERGTWDLRRAGDSRRELQRNEQELRRLLYQALREGYLREEQFEVLVVLLSQLRRQQPVIAATQRRQDEWTGQVTA